MAAVFVITLLLFLVSAVPRSDGFPSAPPTGGDPVGAIKGLVSRLLPQYLNQFAYEVIPKEEGEFDVFEIGGGDPQASTRVTLRGNNGVSLAMALNYYLKYTCNSSVSWGRNGTGNNLRLPSLLPVPATTTRIFSPHKLRYYLNVCTVSYSMVWWDFDRWQQEIDWMALNGLNFILSFTGQEFVWQKFYRSLGLTEEEIQAYFSGPAFLAWQRMGNLRGWAGPLDNGWIVKQADLQHRIVKQLRMFGMINILPGFSGHVPRAFQRIFPNATFVRSSNWQYFGDEYSEDFLLEPMDPLFVSLGEFYYTLLIETYGSDHYFNADTYNEMTPSTKDLQFLMDTNQAIYEAMSGVDHEAVFVMQGWLFKEMPSFWGSDQIKAFLSGVPDDNMIILDLSCEQAPVWSKTNSFFGKPFIWCMLHNYGGARGIYGNLDTIANDPIDAMNAPGSTMLGVGMTPEAIEHNPVIYDLMGEMIWRSEKVTDVMSWLDGYAMRRYGQWTPGIHEAWLYLYEGAYRFHWSVSVHSLVERAPELNLDPYWSLDSGKMSESWRLLVSAALEVNGSVAGPLMYDLVDIGRQVLVNTFADLYLMHEAIYNQWAKENTTDPTSDLSLIGRAMKKVIEDVDRMLLSNTNFLLGHWINEARLSAAANSSQQELTLLEFNARNQITTWGPDENINDYAGKAWSGLMKDYYLKRWEFYLESILSAVGEGEEMNFTMYRVKRKELESNWNRDIFSYPTSPSSGDSEGSLSVVAELMKKYTVSDEYVTSNYDAMRDVDIPDNSLYGMEMNIWGKSVNQLVYLCEINPECYGFSIPKVVFKYKGLPGATRPAQGTTLYLKRN